MNQHFLLLAKARTLSEVKVPRMSEDEAREVFENLRGYSRFKLVEISINL